MLSYVLPAPWEHSSKFKKVLPRRFNPIKSNRSLKLNSKSGLTQENSLYHVVLTKSHINPADDPNGQVQTLRICGTYTSSKGAQDAAHRTIFEAGFERDWFVEYDTKEEEFDQSHLRHREGLAVFAKAKDGTELRVHVSVSKDTAGLRSIAGDDGKIHAQLYYVVVTSVLYSEDDTGVERENSVEAAFPSYAKAREFAGKVLLEGKAEDVLMPSKSDFAEYEEAEEDERDCGYGENVVVHAVGESGENFLVSVVQGQELESVRLAEAAMRIG
ncbi:hypothetical protein UCRPC4_g02253 [Phaeomoniella chlamydospora]|uniref:Uncharacterized protein n=1 Tax=Phaeomoniella chlamydospora TaxID=158046 RepID=A0A0G2EQ99_PHACM|nr:hypothetical protein UCRPC4_g02253 [Phaeomoniella chlamydospora]